MLHHTLHQGVRELCEKYGGPRNLKVKKALKLGNVYQAYYLMTKYCMAIGIKTKNIFFLDPHLLMNAAKDKTWTTDKRKNRSPRTSSWIRDLMKTSRWFHGDLTLTLAHIQELDDDTFTDTFAVDSYAKSTRPTEIGTYTHEKFGEELAMFASKMLGLNVLETFIPGRIIHPGIPLFACTPDGIGVQKTSDFHILMNDTLAGCKVTAAVKESGAPQFSFELKTLSRLCDGIPPDEIKPIYIGSLLHGTDWAKEMVVELLKTKLISANWIPSKINQVSQKEDLLHLFTLRGTKIFPRKEYDKIKHMNVGASKYPNFLEWFDQLQENKIILSNNKNIDMYSKRIQPCSIAKPGKAKVIIYETGKTNKPLLELDFKDAPFIIPYNSEHFNQIMLQHFICSAYSKESCQAVYCVGFHAQRSDKPGKEVVKSLYNDSTLLVEDNVNTVQLAIAYMYDIGISCNTTTLFANRICKELGLAEQARIGKNQLSNILLKNNDTLRKTYLYKL